MVATWVRLGPLAAGEGPADTTAAARTGDEAAAVPLVVELAKVPLAPGALARIRQTLVVPSQPGRWALVMDIEDDVAGSYAALGSAPAVALFEVVTPPAARGRRVVLADVRGRPSADAASRHVGRSGRTIDPEPHAQENGPMDPVLEPRKTIGLVAHDNKKADLIEWCHYNRALLVSHA